MDVKSYERLNDNTDLQIVPYKVFITSLPWKIGFNPELPIDDDNTGTNVDIVADCHDVLGKNVTSEEYCRPSLFILNCFNNRFHLTTTCHHIDL